MTDGAFNEQGAEVRFLPAPVPTPERMTAVLAQVRKVLAAVDEDDDLELDPDALGDGLREWFDRLGDDAGSGRLAAAFDTRVHASPLLTGQASKGIAKRLRKDAFELLVDGESFFVDKSNHLEAGEADRATAWGRTVADAAQSPR